MGAANYRWTFMIPLSGVNSLSAEQWLRHVWEDAPRALRVFLRFGWRFGLGLRLGPADESHILGWRIGAHSDAFVVVSAKSRILTAQNTLSVSSGGVRWQTDVRYQHLIGRLVWVPASLLHQRIVPWCVRRSIRSGD
ncbi:MAG: hypothetical protein JWM34_3915 [Ilumatobacteraceae bacterium]|nr:hypothetical protein [Ilumatobacteraceae bacterium]